MIFRPFKRACLTAWSEFILFHSFWLALNWYTERILQAISAQLNTLFSRQRELNFNDEGIYTFNILYVERTDFFVELIKVIWLATTWPRNEMTVVGYFKKCVTFLLQYSRFCETIIAELHARACGAPKLSKSTHPRKVGNRMTVHRPSRADKTFVRPGPSDWPSVRTTGTPI